MPEKLERNSGIELFRILATFLVLIVHLNGWMAGGLVDFNDSSIGMDHKICQLGISSLSIVCVNCFLIISGWFGIKMKFFSFWKLWVMLFTIYVPFYIFDLFTGHHFSLFEFANRIIAFSCESYFIQNYLMLLFLSPVLNSFIEKYKSKVTVYALSLFLIEVVMESLFDNQCLFIKNGYSLIHFIIIYMLARAASINKDKILSINKRWWIIGYFTCAIIVCAFHFTPYKHTWAYSNPIVVIESFMFFFPFLHLRFSSKFINRIAGGALAVYVIQVTNPVCETLFTLDQYALESFEYIQYLFLLFGFTVIFFALCILYKEVMHFIFSPIFNPLGLFVEKK